MMDWFKALLPGLVLVLYLVTAILHAVDREWAWATVWSCYAMANAGLIWAALEK